MAISNPSRDPQQPSPQPKPKWYQKPTIPLAIGVCCLTIAVMAQMGYVTLPKFHLQNPGIYEIQPPAIIGKPYIYDFSELISLLPQESQGSTYTFYIGSGVGFPPMGLILGIDGKLKGTPTAKAGNFEVCVKDVGGKSVCRKYHLIVNSIEGPTVTPSPHPIRTCPKTSCDTGTCCGAVQNGIRVSGVLTYGNCSCPTDTHFVQQDVITAGGPYNICTCNQDG